MVSVGGIYTVIRSKCNVTVEEWGDQYCLLGPYKEHQARTEIEPFEYPEGSVFHAVVSSLREQGWKVRFNRGRYVGFCVLLYVWRC